MDTEKVISIPPEQQQQQQINENSDPFWGKEFSILFKSDRLPIFFPNNEMTIAERFNAITRLALYISVVLALYKNQIFPIYIFIAVLGLTYHSYMNNTIENFDSVPTSSLNCVHPTSDNIVGNLTIEDLYSNSDRPPACPFTNEQIRKESEDAFSNGSMFLDFNENYGKFNAMRNFYPMPSTSSMPDTESFAKWLFKGSESCKLDRLQCGKNLYVDIRQQRDNTL